MSALTPVNQKMVPTSKFLLVFFLSIACFELFSCSDFRLGKGENKRCEIFECAESARFKRNKRAHATVFETNPSEGHETSVDPKNSDDFTLVDKFTCEGEQEFFNLNQKTASFFLDIPVETEAHIELGAVAVANGETVIESPKLINPSELSNELTTTDSCSNVSSSKSALSESTKMDTLSVFEVSDDELFVELTKPKILDFKILTSFNLMAHNSSLHFVDTKSKILTGNESPATAVASINSEGCNVEEETLKISQNAPKPKKKSSISKVMKGDMSKFYKNSY